MLFQRVPGKAEISVARLLIQPKKPKHASASSLPRPAAGPGRRRCFHRLLPESVGACSRRLVASPLCFCASPERREPGSGCTQAPPPALGHSSIPAAPWLRLAAAWELPCSVMPARFFQAASWILPLQFRCRRKAGGAEMRAAARERGPGAGVSQPHPSSQRAAGHCSCAGHEQGLQSLQRRATRAGRGRGQAPEPLALAGAPCSFPALTV